LAAIILRGLGCLKNYCYPQIDHNSLKSKESCIFEMAKCDFEGKCKNKAYAEVYPYLGKTRRENKHTWSYLCKRHYYQELKRFKGKLPSWIIKKEMKK
jgi:hypothetical protein